MVALFFLTFFNNILANVDELFLTGIILIFSLLVTSFLTKKWIRSANAANLTGKDMNKINNPLIPRSGGLVVSIVICFALLIYIFLKTFSFLGTPFTHVIEVFAISSTILLAGFIGFIDDILGWKTGLSQLQKVLLTIPIALPLTVLNVDQTVMMLPFVGSVDLGLLYPLLVVPLGVIGATNGFNLLAGYNGLEAGMGLVIFSVFGFTGIIVEKLWIALIATLAILGNMERIAIWLFIPYFLEIILYFRARFIDKMGDVQAFAKPNQDGSLDLPYEKIYDTTHFAIKILKRIKTKVYEKDVVLFVIGLQILVAISGIILLLYL